ncbi:MAG: hypothetical protein A3C02_04035 [Candidatus Andersenbacteria bacterium RIFCSPHIGHO2_02_FULL_45_11]|uniref:SHS2 domain-containing protein n=1 Tax=Candidatus Andersenbacteria bacterium RIFCSPHIGHO2_12_FULL_45_11 TaxID=1797281 RepID=A0A1G1WZW0_9BACT|nr:MAG: hypothetical protein A2805_00750 [Candidatus Andersenbacteria bacterium RIFCSPHIGHO2_01_FULL_46_36]OGY33081.1 MAG: hypothetical protein A3D99_01330 [Candidatus Andersenbacteria bacterium RIFCSPHIGHO2_12_FULL_45_11]OGY33399.1 MAG: hypothetical protein A3C02_04035 [Candidatus Andersenbacteria bacterium RIFCSPHIGHO2_02_FULL_45_11]
MIGIDISDRSVKIAEVSSASRPQFKTVCWSPLPAGLLRRGIVQDVPTLIEHLKTTCGKCSPFPLSQGPIVASIPETRSFIRVLDVPILSQQETDEAVQWAIRKDLPFDLKSVYVGWQPIASSSSVNMRQVLVGAAQRAVIDPLLAALDGAGFSVVALELESQAMVRSLLPLDSASIEGVVICDLGASTTKIIYFDRGAMRLTADVPSGGDRLTAELVRAFSITPEIAAEKKSIIGVIARNGEDGAIATTLRGAVLALAQEVHSTIESALPQLPGGGSVRGILLSGGGANLPGIRDIFGEVFPGIPVQIGNPLTNLTSPAMSISPQDASHFVTALGLALRTDGLNLLPPPRRHALALKSMVENTHHFLSSITMGLALLTLVGTLSLGILQSLISATPPEKSAQLDQVMSQYAALRESVSSQNVLLSAISGVSDKRLLWSDKIHELLGVIPGGVHIQAIRATGGDAPSISFSGQAATRNALIILEQRLKSISWATSVKAPNSNLIDRTNAPYEFIMLLK